MKTIIFKMEPFGCPTCVTKINKVLSKESGVEKVKVQFFSNKVKINFNDQAISEAQLEQTLQKLGYPVIDRQVKV